MVWSAVLGGCVVPAPVEEGAAGPAMIHIDEAKVKPGYKEKVEPNLSQDPPLGPVIEFDVATAVKTVNVQQPLRYAGDYDWADDPGTKISPSTARIYAPQNGTCSVLPCRHPGAVSDSKHRMLFVVSDADLPATAETPFEFPEGTAWDSFEWTLITYQGACVQ